MRNQLTSQHYLSRTIFEQERERLFGRLWIFAGLSTLVARSDAYFTREIAGRQIVIQNFDGELRAFENVCAHRQKLLQTEQFGTRALVCGYHGWRYAADGRVANIPFDDCYKLDQLERQSLGLRRFALTQVGSLLFVNLADHPLSMEQQFKPELLAELEDVSRAFDDDALFASWRGRYNWKLAYENLRDALHPRFVHTRSLNREVRFGVYGEASSAETINQVEGVGLPRLSFGGVDGELLQQQRHGFHAQVQRWGTTDAYYNWLLYPNTHIVSPDGGYLFSIEQHIPVAPDTTELVVYFMSAKKRRQYLGASSVLWEYAKGAKRILDEDTAVMEQVQAASSAHLLRGTQGRFEHQNRLTDCWYLQHLAEA